MHSVLFHISPPTRLYELVDLRVTDILSICNPLVQLDISYSLIALTSKTPTEDDVSFFWEQISGTPVLELVSETSPRPAVLLSSDILDDVVFKLYIDKDTEYEQSITTTIFRTPTTTATPLPLNNEFTLLPYESKSLQVNAPKYVGLPLLNDLRKININVVPELGNLKTTQITDAQNIEEFTVIINNPLNLKTNKHKVNKIEARNPLNGQLLAASNFKENLINIPKNTVNFYLSFEVILNFYNDLIPNKTIFFNDNQVRNSYFSQYTQELKYKTIYVTESMFITNKQDKNNINSTNELLTSLPQTLLNITNLRTIQLNIPAINNVNIVKQVFKPIFLLVLTGNLKTIKLTNQTNNLPISLNITRLSGITIGG